MGKKKKKISIWEVLRRIIFVVALVVFIISAWQLYTIFKEYQVGIDEYKELRGQIMETVAWDEDDSLSSEVDESQSYDSVEAISYDTDGSGNVFINQGLDVEDLSDRKGVIINGISIEDLMGVRYNPDFPTLLGMNPEVVGWIKIEDTHINYPMVQGPDNDKYIRTTLTGQYNNAGSIFVDYRVETPFGSRNTLIHGHNQRNQQMFHDLVKYKDKEYFEEHPYIMVYTPQGYHLYQIYSCYETPSTSKSYNVNLTDDALYQSYLDFTMQQSAYDTGFNVTISDKIITLSTCTNDWKDGRFVIHAKQIS